ncbi:hypothetical protein Ac2012v2_007359 [Leucoagaricus gongylophorus]
MVRTIRVALFICGELTPKLMANHGDMLTIYQQWLRNSLPRYSGVRLVMHGYDAPGMIYPNELQLSRYHAVMLTGSRASSPLRMRLVQMLVGCLASDAGGDEPWIKRLVTFVQHVGDEHPQIKIYGICFGHQIVNRALGGIVQRNANGWELGPSIVRTTDIGKILFGVDKLVRNFSRYIKIMFHSHPSRPFYLQAGSICWDPRITQTTMALSSFIHKTLTSQIILVIS